jgi:hypothetical protein
MKSKYIISSVLTVFVLFLAGSCEDEDKLVPVDYDELNVSGGAFATEISFEGSPNVNKLDPSSSSFSKTYQMITPKGGDDITKIDLYTRFTGMNVTADEVLFASVDSGAFSGGGDYPEVTFTVDGVELLSKLGLTEDQLEGGDVFNFRLALTTPDGVFTDVSANFDNQSADHTYAGTVICVPPTVPAGDWIVEMGDSYGDGWQTSNGNGGPGITVTLSTGEVFEVGLCSPYEASSYACTDEFSSGTATITIPDGVESAEWVFPGDFFGEITVDIYAPSGNLVASYPLGSPAGPIALNLCNETL